MSGSETAIRVEGLGKQYRIGAQRDSYPTLRDSIARAAKKPFRRLLAAVRGEPILSAPATPVAMVCTCIASFPAIGTVSRCEPRTGSTALCDCLNSHPQVDCRFDVLNQGHIPQLHAANSKGDLKFYLTLLLQSMRGSIRSGELHFDFLERFELTVDDLLDWFSQARFLVVYRSSILEQFVSLKLAEATNLWGLYVG